MIPHINSTMSTSYSGKLFLLGATGYVGAEFLAHLKDQFPNIHVVALVRNATDQRKASLTRLNPNLSVVEGTSDDLELIRDQVSKADISVNAISAGGEFIDAILSGLEDASKQRPGNPPIYLHISGYGVLSDGADGQVVEKSKIPKYIDSSFSLDDLPPTSANLAPNKAVVAAGERKENPVKTLILFPGWIYGIGREPQPITLAFRLYFNFAKAAGRAVTLGPGHNVLPAIHVKDVAASLIAMLRGALDGTAGTGAQGLYFAGEDFEAGASAKEIQDVVGNILYDLGLVSQSGSTPAPPELRASIPDTLFTVFGGNSYAVPQRLKQLGVEFTETKNLSLVESLPEEIRIAAKIWA
ncbi:hypothetical protein AX16_000172 [Volvariella volvacea WC 439]|nr:hypothetical protein AX16_000172 [Volvariella volvacea WC 439]